MDKSVVIIGGGIGGLFTGAILAKEGLQVTVLEKNANIGGGLQSFSRFGEVFDAGMHIVGGLYEGGSTRRLCEYLGVFDKMHIKPVDDNCIDEIYIAEDRKTYRIAKGREGFVESLASYFPEERDNLRQYVDRMYELTEELDLFYLRHQSRNIFDHSEEFIMSAGDFIDKYISDSRLRSILAYMNPLYGGIRDTTPAYIHSILNVLYINGANRFQGGCIRFAEELKNLIESCGGMVKANDGVSKIFSQDRLISKVVTESGREYSADYFISDVHPCTLVRLLDDKKVLPKAFRMRMEMVPNSYSTFTLYIKLKPGKMKYINHTCYYTTRYADVWDVSKCDDQWPRAVMYMTPPEIEQGEFSNKMIVTAPMTWDQVAQWENTTVGRRGEDYIRWKREMMERLLARMVDVIPDFKDCIEDLNSASPLTIRDYFGVKEGSMYGFMKDCNDLPLSQLPVVTKIPNLLLTGQNNNLHGFCGVPLTAVNTCEVILGENYILDRVK